LEPAEPDSGELPAGGVVAGAAGGVGVVAGGVVIDPVCVDAAATGGADAGVGVPVCPSAAPDSSAWTVPSFGAVVLVTGIDDVALAAGVTVDGAGAEAGAAVAVVGVVAVTDGLTAGLTAAGVVDVATLVVGPAAAVGAPAFAPRLVGGESSFINVFVCTDSTTPDAFRL